jgi:hypothetical protein
MSLIKTSSSPGNSTRTVCAIKLPFLKWAFGFISSFYGPVLNFPYRQSGYRIPARNGPFRPAFMHTNFSAMNTTQKNEARTTNEQKTSVNYSKVWESCGINPRQFGMDPVTTPGPEVLPNGALVIKSYKGKAGQLWFYRSVNGDLRVTIRYTKTGKDMRARLASIDQPPWRTLHQTLEAAAAHGYLRLKRDRKAEMEARREAEKSAVSAQNIEEAVEEVA